MEKYLFVILLLFSNLLYTQKSAWDKENLKAEKASEIFIKRNSIPGMAVSISIDG